MKKPSWQDRISLASQQKSIVEDSNKGVFIEFMLVDFFISESVIPDRCKIYRQRRLHSFNLSGINLEDLAVKEIFRTQCENSFFDMPLASIDQIKLRLDALWLILEYNADSLVGIAESAYTHAVLGAIASLFTSLIDHPQLCGLINLQFKKIFRKFAYHFKRVFISQGLDAITLLASHFYEHCRKELECIQTFSKLTKPINIDERQHIKFKTKLLHFLNLHSIYYEYNDSLIENLSIDKAELDSIILALQKNPSIFWQNAQLSNTHLAICGNALGVLVGNISANTMSLLKKRTYSEKTLNEAQRKTISAQYGHYVQIGAAFRHNKLSYTALPGSMGVELTQTPQKHLLRSNTKPVISHSPTLFNTKGKQQRLLRIPSALSVHIESYTCLWGLLPNGKLAYTDDAETLQLLSVIPNSKKPLLLLSLNPIATQNDATSKHSEKCSRFLANYFRHACQASPLILLKHKLVVGAFQYLHIIDTNDQSPEPEIILILKDGGVTKLLALSDDQFAAGDGAGNVSIINTTQGKIIYAFSSPASHKGSLNGVSAMTLLPDDRLAVGYNNGNIVIWNLLSRCYEMVLKIEDDLEDIMELPNRQNNHQSLQSIVKKGGRPSGGIFCLEQSLQGNLFAGYGDKIIYLWDLQTRQPIKSFIGHTDWPLCLKACSDNTLISGGKDKTLKIWHEESCLKSIQLSHGIEAIELFDDNIMVADRKISSTFSLSKLRAIKQDSLLQPIEIKNLGP